MFVKNVLRLFFLLHLGLFCTLAGAEQTSLFTDDEILLLNHSEDEWVLELDHYRRSRTGEPDGWVDELDPFTDEHNSVQQNKSAQTRGSNNSLNNKGGFGPIVVIVDPEAAGEYFRSSVPVSLLVYLKSRQAPINIDSLMVKGKRGFFSLNITKKIKKYLRHPQQGENADYVIDAKIPKLGTGKYLITLSLSDINGNLEERSIFLEVIKK